MKIMIDGRSILLEKMSALFIGKGTVENMQHIVARGYKDCGMTSMNTFLLGRRVEVVSLQVS